MRYLKRYLVVQYSLICSYTQRSAFGCGFTVPQQRRLSKKNWATTGDLVPRQVRHHWRNFSSAAANMQWLLLNLRRNFGTLLKALVAIHIAICWYSIIIIFKGVIGVSSERYMAQAAGYTEVANQITHYRKKKLFGVFWLGFLILVHNPLRTF